MSLSGAAPTLPTPTWALRQHKFQLSALKSPRRRVVVFVCSMAYHHRASCLSLAAQPQPAVHVAPLPGTAGLPALADKGDGWGGGWLHHSRPLPGSCRRSLSPEECVFEGWRVSMGCKCLPAWLSAPPPPAVGVGATHRYPTSVRVPSVCPCPWSRVDSTDPNPQPGRGGSREEMSPLWDEGSRWLWQVGRETDIVPLEWHHSYYQQPDGMG